MQELEDFTLAILIRRIGITQAAFHRVRHRFFANDVRNRGIDYSSSGRRFLSWGLYYFLHLFDPVNDLQVVDFLPELFIA